MALTRHKSLSRSACPFQGDRDRPSRGGSVLNLSLPTWPRAPSPPGSSSSPMVTGLGCARFLLPPPWDCCARGSPPPRHRGDLSPRAAGASGPRSALEATHITAVAGRPCLTPPWPLRLLQRGRVPGIAMQGLAPRRQNNPSPAPRSTTAAMWGRPHDPP